MQDQPNPSDNPKQDIYDLTGAVFGLVTVVNLDHHDPKQGRNYWRIRCICGTESVRPANEFRNKVPPCKGCEILKLREKGLSTPAWMMDLGFDESFTYRLFSQCRDEPPPPHKPEIGPCLIWPGAVTSTGRGSIHAGYVNGKRFTISVHRAAYIHGSGQPIPGDPKHDCVLHKCDVPRCIRYSHLFLGNEKINSDDMIFKGRAIHPAAEKHPNAIFTNEQVREIRNLRQTQNLTYKKLAEIFKCCPSTIAWIIQGHRWKDI